MKNVFFLRLLRATLIAFIAFFIFIVPSRSDADWNSYSKFYSVVKSYDKDFVIPADIASFDFSNTALLILIAASLTPDERDIVLNEVEKGLFLWILDEESLSENIFGTTIAPCYAKDGKRLIGGNPALPVIDVYDKKSIYFRETEEIVFNHPSCMISAPGDGKALLKLNNDSAADILIYEKSIGRGKILGIFDVSVIIDLSLASPGNEKLVRNIITHAVTDGRNRIAILSPKIQAKSKPMLTDETKRMALLFLFSSLAILALIFFFPSFRANFLRIPQS